MKVLLIGDANRVTNEIVNKLNKEGHSVYALMSSKKTRFRHVYEKYVFDYANTCIKDVFESILPDLTIFTGAFDTSFDWKGEQDAQLAFSAGLSNILAAYSRLGKGRFVYLSSEKVYKADAEALQADNDYDTVMARSIRQGEITCVNYRIATGLDIVVVRAENISYAPHDISEAYGECARMCIEALNKNEITCNGMDISLLALPDAVQFMYNIFTAEKHKFNIYTLTCMNAMSSGEVIDVINNEFGFKVPVNYTVSSSVIWVEELDVHDYSEEFPFAVFYRTQDCVEETVKAIKKNSKKFIVEKKVEQNKFLQIMLSIKNILYAFIPFIENMICFIPFFMINNRAVGSQFFGKLDSYLIYVLLFAIIYGQQQATFSAILAVAGFCFRQMYTKSGFEVVVDYNTYVWIAQLLILGLAVGYLRDQLVLIRKDKDDEIEYLKHRLRDIEDINKTNVRLKNEMERQIVSQSDSMGKIYEITSSLDKYEPEEVLFQAADVVSKLMESRDVAIYTVSNEKFARLIAFTSKEAKKLGNSIEYRKYVEMYTEFEKDHVFINRKMDPALPMMALAVRPEGITNLIVMLWDIPFERMNLSMANRLKIIGSLTQNSVVRANRYMDILSNQRYIEGTRVLEKEAFDSLVKAFNSARKRGLAECSFIEIDMAGESIENAGANIEKVIRNTDYMGDMGDGKLCVMLASTDSEATGYVEKRLADAGYSYRIPKEMD